MKSRLESKSAGLQNRVNGTVSSVRDQIREVKASLFRAHRAQNRRHDHLLRLALNEAEALAAAVRKVAASYKA